MNPIEENVQKYQVIQDDKIYILSTGLIGKNLKLTCYEDKENTGENMIYSSIFTIEQLRRANPIFQLMQDCEDVQGIFEDVILAQSIGILEGQGILDVYFYVKANGRSAKIIIRLIYQIPPQQKLNPPQVQNSQQPQRPTLNEYQLNQERLTRLQFNANQLLNEQNDLRRQLKSFFGESIDDNIKENHTRSRSTNQNNNYHNQLNDYNITNNIAYNQNNNMPNISRVQISDDDNEIYEVPPTNDIAP